jgi:putative transposon-encoded protein
MKNIEICTGQCGDKDCQEEFIHSKSKKHLCDDGKECICNTKSREYYSVKPSDELIMSGEVLNNFKRVVVAETLEINPSQLFTGKVVKSGNGASISFKKRFIGKEVYIIVKE